MLKNPRIWKFDELYLLGVLRSIGCMLDIAPLIGCNFKHKLTLTNALNTINYQANGLFNNAVDQQIKFFYLELHPKKKKKKKKKSICLFPPMTRLTICPLATTYDLPSMLTGVSSTQNNNYICKRKILNFVFYFQGIAQIARSSLILFV
jgi:hypothetical protein